MMFFFLFHFRFKTQMGILVGCAPLSQIQSENRKAFFGQARIFLCPNALTKMSAFQKTVDNGLGCFVPFCSVWTLAHLYLASSISNRIELRSKELPPCVALCLSSNNFHRSIYNNEKSFANFWNNLNAFFLYFCFLFYFFIYSFPVC